MKPKYFERPRGIFQTTVLPIVGLINFSLLAFPILFINFLQVLTLLVYPFSPRIFRKINRTFANLWWGAIIFMMEGIYKMSFVFTGDLLQPRENVIAYANHQGMIDIPAIMPLAWRMARLGDLKFFVKDILKFAPGPGWGMVFLGCIFVKRDWYADKENIDKTFAKLKKNSVPVWLMSFVEGTRISEKKIKLSQAFAKKTGVKSLKHVLIPRTKGFVGTVQGLRDHVTAVYDFTIGYPDGIPSLWDLMCLHPKRFHVHARRYPVSGLPETSEELSVWLLERYEEKDELLEEFYTTGKFPGKELVQPYPGLFVD